MEELIKKVELSKGFFQSEALKMSNRNDTFNLLRDSILYRINYFFYVVKIERQICKIKSNLMLDWFGSFKFMD